MEAIVEFIKGFDLQHIISTFAIVWLATKDMRIDLKEIKGQTHSIDMRLTRLEGRFDERGYWESRDKKIGE